MCIHCIFSFKMSFYVDFCNFIYRYCKFKSVTMSLCVLCENDMMFDPILSILSASASRGVGSWAKTHPGKLLMSSDHTDVISSVFSFFVPNFPLQIRLSQLDPILFGSAHTCAVHHPNTSGLCPCVIHLVRMTTAATPCRRQLICACINWTNHRTLCISRFVKKYVFPYHWDFSKQLFNIIILSSRPFKGTF